MKYISKPLYLLGIITAIFISCNNNKSESSKPGSGDSGDKYNPAAEQKSGSTYNPKETATDTMYKDRDTIPR